MAVFQEPGSARVAWEAGPADASVRRVEGRHVLNKPGLGFHPVIGVSKSNSLNALVLRGCVALGSYFPPKAR